MSDIYLSVAVCTRNRAAVLGECVESILASCARQARPWELIVVDNGSTDRTGELLAGFSAEPRLRVVREDRMGISYARNAAVANASGKVLAFIDDDEIVQDDWADVLCSEYESQGVEVLGGVMLPIWETPPPWWLTQELHTYLGLIESKEIVTALRQVQAEAIYTEIQTDYGHDAFLLEAEQLSRLISNFLAHGANNT